MSIIDKLPLTSHDIATDKLEQLRGIFPEVFAEGKIDHDTLLRMLGKWVEPGKERFGLNWPGKADCMKVIQSPSVGTLLPMRDDSVNFDTSENLIIEGDNLEVLKLLQRSYYGKVKMIYIDPPYNTGNEFIYPDNFHEGLDEYLRFSGQVDAEGYKLNTNTETEGRYHSKWLSMMYPRLFLARNLLRENGVIFVSIDDNEVHNLRALMNEVFGEENFVATVIWEKADSPRNTARQFSEDHDFILVYSRDPGWTPTRLPRTEESNSIYSNPDNDQRGEWLPGDPYANKPYSKGQYSLKGPTGRTFSPPPGRFWRISEEKLRDLDEQGRIWWGPTGEARPSIKRYLSEVSDLTPRTLWKKDEVGSNRTSKNEIRNIFPESESFDTPKPSRLISRMLRLCSAPLEEDIVLDFFAGSGTTGHAVIEMNKEDSGNRRFILVQLPEKNDNKDYPTIAHITRERVRRVIKKLNEADSSKLDLDDSTKQDRGFKAFKLSSSNFKVWESDTSKVADVNETLSLFVDNIMPGRLQEDILYELMVKAGYPLSAQVETLSLADKEVFSVAGGDLLICLDKELTLGVVEAMVKRKPARILCLDEGFHGNDQLKVNVVQTVKSHNRKHESGIVFQVV